VRRVLTVLLALSLLPVAACGRDRVQCEPAGGLRQITVCATADPAHAELHIITQVVSQTGGKGMFIDAPDVIRRAPYQATIDYKTRDDRGKPTGVVVTMKVIPQSPNIKSVTCKIYNEKQLVNHQTKDANMSNREAVCVYETPLPKA